VKTGERQSALKRN